ncbi:hypothetical protein P872_20570 [Rhodonellum psychrophilum GCM71 = DSM 17998]|uniref:Uncharacterized protein n=1 Tax=Rhodonellum psychrophilum GCM71 = DSM 17998 TaxID=1123057 RepID=U5BL18_9BACT|nr:hypothetical protein P872_20570 [Rhodonellum psychrophilum GCM71 = DSM 17998]
MFSKQYQFHSNLKLLDNQSLFHVVAFTKSVPHVILQMV